MVRRMTDIPVGTIGFEASGEVDDGFPVRDLAPAKPWPAAQPEGS